MNSRTSSRLVIVLLAVLLAVGQAGAQAAEVAGSSIANPALTLRPGDALRITVWPNAELGGEFGIDEAGYVYLPVLAAVRVAGIPVDRVREELRLGYAEAMRNPVVNVTPVFSVTVTGAVQRPGIYAVTPTHSLFDVLGMAGGFHASANAEQVRVVRPGQVIRFDALRALEHGEGLEGVQLRSGDQIVVPQARSFNWRNILTVVQTLSLLFVTYERVTR
jgi:protein involved in polysaccharide export with SLBB domain